MSDGVTMAEVLAAQAGTTYGKNAAAWAIEPERSTREQMQRALKGIEDGDPHILDAFAEPNLSGEQQDAPTPASVAAEAGLEPEDDNTAACEAWEEAARSAFWGEVERILKYHTEEV